MKGVFVSYNCLKEKSSGGVLVSKRNLSYLSNLGCDFLDLQVFDSNDILLRRGNKFNIFRNSIKNFYYIYSFSFNRSILLQIFDLIENHNYCVLFLDSTLFGSLAKFVKLRYPEVKILVFSHNSEVISSWHALKYQFSFKNLYRTFFSYINEKRIASYSDYIVGLSSFDEKYFKILFKAEFDCIIPVTISDNFKYDNVVTNQLSKLKILFVGSYFYPNIHGISWFIENVLSHINADLTVIGKDMSNLASKYHFTNLEIIDYVTDLNQYYLNTDVVISPIFIGSGMKVKIAEALMYGKKVLGTKLSFQGFMFDNDINILCHSKDDYISAINSIAINRSASNKFHLRSREVYLQNYSDSKNDFYFKPLVNFLKNIER